MGKGAPPPDPRIGEAAMLSARTGQDYLAFMKNQAAISTPWAIEDRARYVNTFRPVEDQIIADAKTYDSPLRQAEAANEAAADVSLSNRLAGDQMKREAMAMGVNPNSGRFLATRGKMATAGALAEAGARNTARRTVRTIGDAKRADVANMGRGLALNPGTSLGLSTNAMSAGFQGAMAGYGQQGSLLVEDHKRRMDAWEANQGMFGGLGRAIGSIVGAFSSEDLKTEKRPVRDLTKAIKSMRVEKWRYKDGVADEAEHIGPYAEEFQKATGVGDGRTIKFQDAIGVTMGAVKEIAEKVDRIERRIKVAA